MREDRGVHLGFRAANLPRPAGHGVLGETACRKVLNPLSMFCISLASDRAAWAAASASAMALSALFVVEVSLESARARLPFASPIRINPAAARAAAAPSPAAVTTATVGGR